MQFEHCTETCNTMDGFAVQLSEIGLLNELTEPVCYRKPATEAPVRMRTLERRRRRRNRLEAR